MVDEPAPLVVAQRITMSILRSLDKEGLIEDPDRIGRTERVVILAAVQLLAVEIGPGIEDARGQILREDQELDLHLKHPAGRVAGFDVDDGELVVEGLALVVGVEDIDLGDGCFEILREQGVEEVDEQIAPVVGPEQGFEDAVDLGVDGAVHAKSV